MSTSQRGIALIASPLMVGCLSIHAKVGSESDLTKVAVAPANKEMWIELSNKSSNTMLYCYVW